MNAPALLTIEETAATLKCSRRRVFDLLADGTIVRAPRFGKRVHVLAESVFTALEAAYHPPPAARKRIRRRQSKAEFEAAIDAL